MYPYRYKEVAIKYRVEDLPGASIPGAALCNILKHLELGEKPISKISEEFLRTRGLLALLHYARKEFSFPEFAEAAELEQSERRLAAETNASKEQAALKLKQEEQRLREEAWAAAWAARRRITPERAEAERRSFENDPKNRAKAKQLKLRQKYRLNSTLSHFHRCQSL